MRTIKYGDTRVPVHERWWTAGPKVPYRKTYRLSPGQHWSNAESTPHQNEHYVLVEGQQLPVGAVIARELILEGATHAYFTEIWGRVVFVGHDLVCVEAEGALAEFVSSMRAALAGRLYGLPDVLGFYPDGRVALREAKNVSAKDKLRPNQHNFARAAQRLFGARLDCAIVEWGLVQKS